MQFVATRKAHQNKTVVDPWTVVHLSTGLALGLMDLPLRQSLAAAVVYELAEQAVERQAWGKELFKTSRPEAVLNSVMDVAVFSLGHWLGQAWNRTGVPRRG